MDRRRILLVVAVVVAVLGAMLVFVYARSADSRASQDVGGTTPVLVVAQQIAAGESADSLYASGKVIQENVPTSALVSGATDDGSLFAGKVALTDMYPGEQLIPQKFGDSSDVNTKPIINVPQGYLTFTINLADVNHVGPFLQPGQHVALWYVPPAGTGTDAGGKAFVQFEAAKVLIPDVLVVSVGNEVPAATTADGTGSAIATAPTTTIGIAAPPAQVAIIGGASFASSAQTLFMTLLSGKSDLKTDSYFTQGS